LHAAHLLVESKKMSKSLGNFFTPRDLLQRGFKGREIRYLLLKGHYRETFNFTLAGLEEARKALGRLDECLLKVKEVAGKVEAGADPVILRRFTEALDEDLNISEGLGEIFEWVRELNRLVAVDDLQPAQASAALGAWDRINSVLGLGRPEEIEAPPELSALLEEREAARNAKDFKRADALRDELGQKGWLIEDTPKGARLRRLEDRSG